jgi:hypothetical protein
MEELFNHILKEQAFMTALTTLLIVLVGYLTSKVNFLKSLADERTESLKSIKRGSLRNEYIQIYNSKDFTYYQKYGLTRDIVKNYKKLNGNHYISELDAQLKEDMENEARQQNL